jgi:hypothetical protein
MRDSPPEGESSARGPFRPIGQVVPVTGFWGQRSGLLHMPPARGSERKRAVSTTAKDRKERRREYKEVRGQQQQKCSPEKKLCAGL